MKVRELIEQVRKISEVDTGILDADVELMVMREGIMTGVFSDSMEWHRCRSARMSSLKLYSRADEGWWIPRRRAFPSDMEVMKLDASGVLKDRLATMRDE